MTNPTNKPPAGYRLKIEAVGLTRAAAAASALRVIAGLIQSPDAEQDVSGTNGSASGKFEEIEIGEEGE